MRHGAENVRHGPRNVRHGAKNVRHGAENVCHGAKNVQHGAKMCGSVPTFLHSYTPTFLHSYIPTFLHSYIPSFRHSYIHTFLPSFLGPCNNSKAPACMKFVYTDIHPVTNMSFAVILPMRSQILVLFTLVNLIG